MLIIRPHASPCYDLRYANGKEVDTGDCVPHYTTEQQAREEASRYTIDGANWGTPTPQQRTAPCVSVQCNGCDSVIGEDDWASHFEDTKEALEYARGGDWHVTDEDVRCDYCVIAGKDRP